MAANLLFLFSPSAVMGTTDTIIVAISDPNFIYAGSEFSQALSEWYAAGAKPAIDTLFDGRAELWVTVIFCTLWLSGKVPDFARRGFVSVGRRPRRSSRHRHRRRRRALRNLSSAPRQPLAVSRPDQCLHGRLWRDDSCHSGRNCGCGDLLFRTSERRSIVRSCSFTVITAPD